MTAIAIAFYRTLSSQSSASLTAGYLAAHLRAAGRPVVMYLLERGDDSHDVAALLGKRVSVLFYKPNFKDLSRLHENLEAVARGPAPAVCLFGPYAALNAPSLLATHQRVRAILLPSHEPIASGLLAWLERPDGRPPAGLIFREGNATRSVAGEPTMLAQLAYAIRPSRDIESREVMRTVNLEASRGCPRRCTFCHVPAANLASGVPILVRAVDDVIDEMKQLHLMGKRYLIFNDSIFAGGRHDTRAWLEHFCAELGRAQLDLYFMVYLTFDMLVQFEPLIAKLAHVGLIRIFLGLEAASEPALRGFRKPVQFGTYGKVKRELRRLGIVPHIGFMLFHPFATPSDIRLGIRLLATTDELHRFGVVQEATRLVPGTQLMRQAMSAGLLNGNAGEALPSPGYSFAHRDTAVMFSLFQDAFHHIGLSRLERLEHVFTSGLFLNNLLRRQRAHNQEYQRAFGRLEMLRRRHCQAFHALCAGMLQGHKHTVDDVDRYRAHAEQAEDLWDALWRAAGRAGLEDPLGWTTTGDLLSEVNRPPDYDGRRLTSRSGRINVGR